MRDGKAEASQIVGSGVAGSCGDVVEPGSVWCCDEEWALRILHDFSDGMIEPLRNMQISRQLHRSLAHGLAQFQGHDRSYIRYVFTEHEDCISVFDVIE